MSKDEADELHAEWLLTPGNAPEGEELERWLRLYEALIPRTAPGE